MAQAKGVELEGASAATLWQRLSIQARVEYADLSGRASAALEGLALKLLDPVPDGHASVTPAGVPRKQHFLSEAAPVASVRSS